MRIDFTVILIFLWLSSSSAGMNNFLQKSDRSEYYSALNSSDIDLIKSQLKNLAERGSEDTTAYTGALKMKLAGLLNSPAEKLKTFKEGRKMLESAIAHDSANVEYRFLRLVIQEHAPGILNYKQNLEEDKNLIVKKFRTIGKFLAAELKRYSESSKILRPVDLNE